MERFLSQRVIDNTPFLAIFVKFKNRKQNLFLLENCFHFEQFQNLGCQSEFFSKDNYAYNHFNGAILLRFAFIVAKQWSDNGTKCKNVDFFAILEHFPQYFLRSIFGSSPSR